MAFGGKGGDWIQDSTLIGTVDVTAGLKDSGLMIVDTERNPEELGLKVKY